MNAKKDIFLDFTTSLPVHSHEVDEVLSRPPAWLVRWGITVFFFVLLALLLVSWFVKYPDLVQAPLRVVAVNAPKLVVARSEGALVRLLAKDGQLVQRGQQLAFLESTANPDEVLALKVVVDSLVKLATRLPLDPVCALDVPAYFQLGELQKSYQTFQEAFVRAQALRTGGAFAQKRAALQNDLEQLQRIESNLQSQLINFQSDLQLADADISMQRKLHRDKVIPDYEMRRAQSVYLSKKQTYDQAQSSFNNNGMAQNQKRQELLELTRTSIEQTNGLRQSINTLKSDLEAWQQRFVVSAPTNGKIAFLTQWQEGQAVKAGQELFYVMPSNESCYGEMAVGQYNFGKVRKGQRVIVKFPSYPYQEFGTVRGQVAGIADMSKDTAYVLRVVFPDGLVTNAGKTVTFRNGLTASGEIVTEDLRLMERFFYQLRAVVKK